MTGIDTNTEVALTMFNIHVLQKAYPSLKMEIKYIPEREEFKTGRGWNVVSFSQCPVVILEDGVREVININGCSLSCIIEEMMIAIARIYDENRTLAYCKENRKLLYDSYEKIKELKENMEEASRQLKELENFIFIL